MSLKKALLFSALFFFLSNVFAQQKYWQQQTNYNISVSLNDVDNSLTGFEQIAYYNNSPDTLTYILIHLWPNAYKNDRTAFSDQLLENGRTDFYFSEENKKGYINQLSFKVDNVNATTEDHPQHQDIVKLFLPQPLVPGKNIKIETPFHVKLPYNFSRSGHIGQSYQITQWYPKPAVYDKTGWHEMPYLDQGEFYAEFGNFDVQITLPSNYIVAATGELQNEEEKKWLKEKNNTMNFSPEGREYKSKLKPEELLTTPLSSKDLKTINFKQDNIHDFAWFADKRFNVKQDTLKLNSGRVISVSAYFLPQEKYIWRNSIDFIKKSILTKSNWIGEYPYNVVSVVDNAPGSGAGMEYPTITLLANDESDAAFEDLINHEVGHNWFYGILGTNERTSPWMDEGMNSYYDKRYNAAFIKEGKWANGFIQKRVPKKAEAMFLGTAIKYKKDQPINTASEKFSVRNYDLVAYEKASNWMKLLEKEFGTVIFDKVMKAYYAQWKFKHPTTEDFRTVAEAISGKSLSAMFELLNKKGALEKPLKKQLKLASIFNVKETDKYNYIFLSPAVGFNTYDKLMIGGAVHNYGLPPTNLKFIVTPMYATGSKKLNGIGRVEYNVLPSEDGDRLIFSLSAAKFTGGSFKDSTGTENPLQFSKLVPSIRYEFANKNPRSSIKKFIQFKSFLLKETKILFNRDIVNNVDVITYPKENRYVNQLQFGIENDKVLYPYDGIVQAEQGDGFLRLNFTGNYYFNYQNGGGLKLRLFAGKFIYTGDKSFTNQYKTSQYHLNLSGPKGDEDYTYSNYFVGRSEFEGFASQQIMNRDGFFKVRTDLLSDKIGRTDDWLAAVNLTTDIPKAVNIFQALPFKLPIYLFADIGTYAEAWKKNASTGRFLYDAGLKVSLFKSLVNIYIPLLYSKVYSDYFKSTITEKRFLKNISFSIDMQQLSLGKLLPQVNF